ncbi:5'-nucleotidase / UDP-sugar diphosphatase [Thermoflexales bacterium]|nr:5'-nucleotidase / UDP-sugar diphosphatase [Thermoflexales bacterium]
MTRLTILHTNDLHGRVEQVFRIAALARQIKQEVTTGGGHCGLWDAGDAEDTILYESSMTKGRAVMALLRGAGYELTALGNATPLRYGPQTITGLAEDFGRPLLCANMFEPESKQLVAGLEPYTLQRFGQLTVGIIGLTDPLAFYSFFNLNLGDPVEILSPLIAEVRAHGAQTIILLSHLGSKKDQIVAESVAGIDLIIGAHDHVALDPPLMINQTIIAQAGDYGRYLGRLDLEIDARTGKIVQHHGQLIPITAELPFDPEAQSAFAVQQERVRQIADRVLGVAASPIDWSPDRECAASNLVADMLRERTQADVALVLGGHWRTGLEAGNITVGQLYAACRSTANPALTTLTGTQLMHFVREGLKPENAARTPKPLRGIPIGWPHVSGMSVHIKGGEPVEFRIDGKPLDADRTYRVAGTDLEFSELVGYLVVPDELVTYEVPTIVPEVLEEYLPQHRPIQPSDQRFFFREE